MSLPYLDLGTGKTLRPGVYSCDASEMRDFTPKGFVIADGRPVKRTTRITPMGGMVEFRSPDYEHLMGWFDRYKGEYIRRHNGENVYMLVGIEKSDDGVKLVLDKLDNRGLCHRRTWAPAEEAEKFLRCDRFGKLTQEVATMDVDTTPERIIEDLARGYTRDTLHKAYTRAEEIEREVLACKEKEDERRAESARIRAVALQALETAAIEGDVKAANTLLDLTS